MSDLGCLIAYYSRKGQNYRSGDVVDLPVGNTEVAARMIQAATSGDLLHLETVKEYPEDYHEATEVASIDGCDVLFLGYPNWWGTPPMAVFTFLESHDFSGKTIIPFCPHEGSGMGRSESDIRRARPGAKVLGGLAIRGVIVHGAEPGIRRWIEATGLVS